MADGRKVELGLGKNLGQLQLEGTVVTNDSNRLAYKQNHSGNPSTLEYNTIIIPRGGEYQLILSDGSRVWLNSDTRLRYPVSFIGENERYILRERLILKFLILISLLKYMGEDSVCVF